MNGLKIKLVLSLILFSGLMAVAQEEENGFVFTKVKEYAATPVKNQYRSGTCWCFSGLSFLESELLREGKGEYDLSEMYIVRMAYYEKGLKYVRLHGNMNMGAGGQFHDVTNMIKKYGIVPEEAYPGLLIDESKHIHGEMDAAIKAYLDAIVSNKNRKLSQNWVIGFNAILDAYLGEVPEKFEYKGKEYTPTSFAKMLGLDWSDYINLSSYTHHPFYEKFGIEIPDNWAWEKVYNLPIDDLMRVLDYSLDKGFTVGWASDVSEKGFNWTDGYAIIPEVEYEELSDLELGKWAKLSKDEKKKSIIEGKEKIATQEDRQEAFNNYLTTDDHGMHIVGVFTNQFGTKFYKVKNSWGTTNHKYDGYFFASEAFVRFKTMDLMVNKNALPKDIAKKLGL